MIENKLKEIIKRLLHKGVDIELRLKDNDIAYDLIGFYKSGVVTLYIEYLGDDEQHIVYKARYDEKGIIDDYDDVVRLNYDWWQRSKDRFDDWNKPDRAFIMDFKRLGYVD